MEPIENAVLIKGNHDDYPEQLMTCGTLPKAQNENGTERTLSMFKEAGITEERIFSFLVRQKDYYETKNYVFTHGWLPLTDDRIPKIEDNWRLASKEKWLLSREIGWHEAYNLGVTLPGKTIMCGHIPSALTTMFDRERFSDDYSPFFGKGVIAVDSYSDRSKRVNVVVLEDDLL